MDRITVELGKKGGKHCIRNLRITVIDILGWLASGMTIPEIIADFPELEREDIIVSLAFASTCMMNTRTIKEYINES